MTIKEINKRVKEIEEALPDYQKAHILEDCLWEDFIKYIANNHDWWYEVQELKDKAKLVLKTLKIKFPRFCG